SVPGDDRTGATELVAEARGDHVDVLMDAVDAREDDAWSGERDVTAAHETVHVVDTDDDVRCNAEVETDTDCTAPTGLAGGVEHQIGTRDKTVVPVIHTHCAALDVEQHVIPSVADLAREQADRVNPGAVGDQAERRQTDIGPTQVSPVALRFQAKYPGGGLPAIADLTTDRAARCVMATFRNRGGSDDAQKVIVIPALVAPDATTVDTDIEATPVV